MKRELHPEALLLDFLLYGFEDPDEGKNVPYARRWRDEKKVGVPKEAWPVERVRKSVIGRLEKRFGEVEWGPEMLQLTIPDTDGEGDDVEIEVLDMAGDMRGDMMM